jgi:hypothetical protein
MFFSRKMGSTMEDLVRNHEEEDKEIMLLIHLLYWKKTQVN